MHILRVLVGCLALGIVRGGQAGPPLSIDDPAILDPGQLEVIVSTGLEERDSGRTWLLPILDASYGISTDVQVAAVVTRVVSDPAGASSKSDLGPGSIGVKWRFMDRGPLQMSVAPYYESQLRDGAVERGVIGDSEAVVLPAQFQYEFASWRLNAELRYAALRDSADAWAYGIAAAVPMGERLEVMAEIHGFAERDFDRDALLYRLGVDVRFSETFHLLASAGAGLDELDSAHDDLDLQAYLGLQWFH
jgi:hypothetical protein